MKTHLQEVVKRLYPNAMAFIDQLNEDINMAKKQAKSKRIVAKRGKKWTVAVSKIRKAKKRIKDILEPKDDTIFGKGVPEMLKDAQASVNAEEAVPPSAWRFYWRLEEAGLYVMKNQGLAFVRVVQIDSGRGVSMQVLAEGTNIQVHPAISSNALYQKIEE